MKPILKTLLLIIFTTALSSGQASGQASGQVSKKASGRASGLASRKSSIRGSGMALAAAKMEPAKTLRLLALEETLSPSRKPNPNPKALSSDAAVDGILHLKDDSVSLNERSDLFSLGFALAPYRPKGQVNSSSLGKYDISRAGATLIPTVSMGYLTQLTNNSWGLFHGGLEASFGYSRQLIDIVTPGQATVDASLNTTNLEGLALIRWTRSTLSKWFAHTGLGIGQRNLVQTSNQSIGQWSENLSYSAAVLGAAYQLNQNTFAELRLASRRRVGSSDSTAEIEVESTNYSIGAKILW